MYIRRRASNEIFSPSNKIHREVGRAKDLSGPRYIRIQRLLPFYPPVKITIIICALPFARFRNTISEIRKRVERGTLISVNRSANNSVTFP
jgi:hypothetical protein